MHTFKAEDLSVTLIVGALLEQSSVVAFKKEIDFQEDGQKDSFFGLNIQTKHE